MENARGFLIGMIVLATSACASGTIPNIEKIDSLRSSNVSDGSFVGIERIATRNENRVVVVYFHGMGWTENGSGLQSEEGKTKKEYLSDDFVRALENAYPDQEIQHERDESNCLTKDDKSQRNGVTLISDENSEGDPQKQQFSAPGFGNLEPITIAEYGCVDRVSIKVGDAYDIELYRLFWDNAFWDSVESRFTGFDDTTENTRHAFQRQKYNAELKNQVVNYGFIDAVTYLSPLGDGMRASVRSALCLAFQNSIGNQSAIKWSGEKRLVSETCTQQDSNSESAPTPFVLVAESMGSKILFDVIQDSQRDESLDEIDIILKRETEIFLLANQIPLLYPGRIALSEREEVKDGFSLAPDVPLPKLVAISEPNDLLTMELVPFFQEFWKTQGGQYQRHRAIVEQEPLKACVTFEAYMAPSQSAVALDEICAKQLLSSTAEYNDLLLKWTFHAIESDLTPEARLEFMRSIGFEPVDVRAVFADPLFGLTRDFIDPVSAHTDHNETPLVFRLMLCGAESGTLHPVGCLAAN